ncbi:MAG: hypothetical protein REI11_18545, partial [Patulibacter sp.]|nr:hypothetical protein [Patulibacter sp.]
PRPPPRGDRMTPDRFRDELDGFGARLAAATARAEARRRRARRVAGGTSVAVLAAVAVVAGIGVVPGPARLDPVAEARAALGTGGEILHFRVTWNYAVSAANSAYSGKGTTSSPQDVWATTSGAVRWRTHQPSGATQCNGISEMGNVAWVASTETAYAGGRLRIYSPWSKLIVIQPKQRPGEQAQQPFPTLPPELGDSRDPASAIRTALDRGLLKDSGIVERSGRRLRMLTGAIGVARRVPDRSSSYDSTSGKKTLLYPGTTIEERPIRLTYTVDADTFAPVELQTRRYSMWSRAGGRHHYVWVSDTLRFQTFERLAPTPEHRALLDLDAPPDTPVAWIRPAPAGSGPRKFLPRASRASMRAADAAAKRCRAAAR